MRKIIIMAMVLLLSVGTVMGAVSRSGNSNSITYTSDLTGTYDRAFWAIEESITGCTINTLTCSSANTICSYSDGVLKVVSYTPDTGGSVATAVSLSISGTGTCAVGPGLYAESTSTSINSATSFSSGLVINLDSVSCNTNADTNCDGVVGDSELLSYATLWLDGSLSDTQLLSAASAWLNS